MPATVWPQPPTCSASVPSRSARYSSAAHTATTTDSATSVMARCSRGLRPANSVSAAPSSRDQHGQRRQHRGEVLIATPPARAARPARRARRCRGRLGCRPVLVERGGSSSDSCETRVSSGSSATSSSVVSRYDR